jgi:sugar lactone lactonase YvrE
MANGIAFAPDGRLCATTYMPNPQMICLKLGANHMEMSRDMVTIAGGGNGDGLAFDKEGNAYVQAGHLFKVAKDGTVTSASPMGGANAEFGAGPVNCKTIFMSGNPYKQVTIDIEGADVPWHRP